MSPQALGHGLRRDERSLGMTGTSCRADVWLWRARFARTRSLAAAMIEHGTVRLTHNGVQARLDKPGRTVHVGDRLVFAVGGRLVDLTIEAFGERRGPAEEARALYRLSTPET